MLMMAHSMTYIPDLQPIHDRYGERLKVSVPLARYTAARIGGPAWAVLEALSCEDLADIAEFLWSRGYPFLVLGGGSNVLVADQGVAAIVVLNQARQVKFELASKPPSVWAESGANFGNLARQAAARGLAGLEWAAGIPGTLGGAVVGNAGAHGSDMAGTLLVAEILHPGGQRNIWPVERLGYSYRRSVLKGAPSRSPKAIVLAARLKLERSTPADVKARSDDLVAQRRRTQPPGASMGSMFKNPPGDYAGRLIEAAGLKGLQVGSAQISPRHANFFINLGGAQASDIYQLIQIARKAVKAQFGVDLELEIELIGDWQAAGDAGSPTGE